MGVLVSKVWNERLSGTKILICGDGFNFFSLLRGNTILKQHSNWHFQNFNICDRDDCKWVEYLLIFFSAHYPKRSCESFRCDPFEAELTKRYQNRSFNPWKVRQSPLSTPVNSANGQLPCVDTHWKKTLSNGPNQCI